MKKTNKDIDSSATLHFKADAFLEQFTKRATEHEPKTKLLNIVTLCCRSHSMSICRTHLNVAKVNSLIVEMGTLCQPGEVTSRERQPKKNTAQQHLISIQHSDTMMERKAKQSKRGKRKISGLCVRLSDAAG